MPWERSDTYGAVVVSILIAVFILVYILMCIEWPTPNCPNEADVEYTLEYYVDITPTHNTSYSIIIPTLVNHSDENSIVDPPFPPYEFTIGNGTWNIVETRYGTGIRVNASERIQIRTFMNLSYSEPRRNVMVNPSVKPSLHLDPYSYYPETIRIFLDNNSLTNVTITKLYLETDYLASLGNSNWCQGSTDRVLYIITDQPISKGWNSLEGTFSGSTS